MCRPVDLDTEPSNRCLLFSQVHKFDKSLGYHVVADGGFLPDEFIDGLLMSSRRSLGARVLRRQNPDQFRDVC